MLHSKCESIKRSSPFKFIGSIVRWVENQWLEEQVREGRYLGRKDSDRAKEEETRKLPGNFKIGFDMHPFALEGSNIISFSGMLFMLVASQIDLPVQLLDPQVSFIPKTESFC